VKLYYVVTFADGDTAGEARVVRSTHTTEDAARAAAISVANTGVPASVACRLTTFWPVEPRETPY